MKYQVIAGFNLNTDEVIYSRAHHDYVTDSENNSIDGGQLGPYVRGTLPNDMFKHIIIELDVDYGTLYDDWNYRYDKYGKTTIDKVKVVDKKDYEDRDSFEFKKKSLTWGTYGKDGKGPRKTICLINAETDHLEAILRTQTHISQEYQKVIKAILLDRKKQSNEN